MEKNPTEVRGEINKMSVRKEKKRTKTSTHTIYRILQKQQKYAKYSSSHRALIMLNYILDNKADLKNDLRENQDGGVGRHTAPPRTTRTDRKSKGKEIRHQGNKK